MSYSRMMIEADKAQRIELEIESTTLKLKTEISRLGYDVDDDALSILGDLVDLLVNDKHTVKGFRNMTLSQYDEAYQNAI